MPFALSQLILLSICSSNKLYPSSFVKTLRVIFLFSSEESNAFKLIFYSIASLHTIFFLGSTEPAIRKSLISFNTDGFCV